MAFWSRWFKDTAPNPDAGEAGGVEIVGVTEPRSAHFFHPSPWAGWPAEWALPHWDFGSKWNELVDVAWNCLDLNSRVLSTMPVYRTKGGVVVDPDSWMVNPDPEVYTSWAEFAKQLFWDFQLGEAFVLPMATYSDGYPMRFRVVPPKLIDVEMRNGRRQYRLGLSGPDVTNEILHIRYQSSTDTKRGVGPLESAGGRMLTAGVLARYIRDVAEIGGVKAQTLETEQELTDDDANEILDRWVYSRQARLAAPPVLDRGVKLEDHKAMSPKDMAMIELAQFTEGRIASLLGVPTFLLNLPGGDSMTYSNVSQVFDYHDRSALRPLAATVMSALSNWALPRGQSVELNRDEYSRPTFDQRADAWKKLKEADLITTEQFQAAERLSTPQAASQLTGGGMDE